MIHIPGAIGFGILTLVILYFAKRANYFAFPKGAPKWEVPVMWYHVATVFAIYFASVTLAVPLILSFFKPSFSPSSPIATAVWINFITSSLIFGFVALYAWKVPGEIGKKIWKRDRESRLLQNLVFALFSFAIAFPLVIFLSEVLDLFLSFCFGISEFPEQLAVRFLKMTFQYPKYFVLSVVTIVVLAPLLEETLFRGFLQSFIRKHLGSRLAIFLTSFCFSFFHYAPEQGLSNISIIGSLFVLSLFLGFVYEKQASLLASIFLHASFNGISVLNLYFLGGFSLTT